MDDEQFDKLQSKLVEMIHMQNAQNVAIKTCLSEIASAVHEGMSKIAEAVGESKT